MSWSEKDLMFDVAEFKLCSKGWKIVEVKEATISPQDKEKNPKSKNDKNFVVVMEVKESNNPDDIGCSITNYFANVSPNDFTLKQLGAMVAVTGVIPPSKITGPEFFHTSSFESNFQMKIPGKLLGVYVDHQEGDRKRDDGTSVFFPRIKKWRTVKDAQKEMKAELEESVKTQPSTKEKFPGPPPPIPLSAPTSPSESDEWE